MANGTVRRFPKRNEDNSIEGDRLIKDVDGTLKKVSELIFTAESPAIPSNFTEEINSLISSGQIEIPETEAANSHIVDISGQLEAAKYTYDFVDKDGSAVKCGDICRVFFNGINVSQDVDISGDRLSFTFINLYGDAVFGKDETRLVIDFVEE